MSDHNATTIQTYENDFDQYMAALSDGPYNPSWIRDGLTDVPVDAKIFEVGSGSGRDADFVESLGYRVIRSDAAKSFIEHLRQSGHTVHNFNLLSNEFPEPPYDVIIADAVLLHFTRDEFRASLQKICSAINPGGKLIFCVQNGQGEKWKENKGGPRYFCYWTEEQLRDELSGAGLIVAAVAYSDDEKWVRVVAEKPIAERG